MADINAKQPIARCLKRPPMPICSGGPCSELGCRVRPNRVRALSERFDPGAAAPRAQDSRTSFTLAKEARRG